MNAIPQSGTAACIVCNDPAHYSFSGRNRLLGGDERFDYCHCASCGTYFLHPMPDAAGVARFYPDNYVPEDDLNQINEIAPLKKAVLKRRHGYAHLRTGLLWDVLASLPGPWRKERAFDFVPGGRLLDVGCGNGRYLRSMKNLGWETAGVEFNQNSVEFCRASGLAVHHGDLVSAAFPAAAFDVITVRHVIEHIPTPQVFMAELARILKPGGTLVVETPNFSALGWLLFNTNWSASCIPQHVVFFSPDNLALLARQHGLQPRRCVLETGPKLILNTIDIALGNKGKGRPSRKIRWRRMLARLYVWLAEKSGRGDIIHAVFTRPA